jgi:chitin synthase
VLPGAFSILRWEAVEGSPVDSFLMGRNKFEHSCFEANMYLAEDRVMCLEVLIKNSENYLLKYLPGAIAVTDAPNHLSMLMK